MLGVFPSLVYSLNGTTLGRGTSIRKTLPLSEDLVLQKQRHMQVLNLTAAARPVG